MTCHRTLQYINSGWVHWCLYSDDTINNPYFTCKLELFDILSQLDSVRFQKTELPSLLTALTNVLMRHAALFPPSEMTYTLHECVHLVSQISSVGPCRTHNMYKYERMNKYLKGLIKNRNYPLASIMKQYAVRTSCNCNLNDYLSIITVYLM